MKKEQAALQTQTIILRVVYFLFEGKQIPKTF